MAEDDSDEMLRSLRAAYRTEAFRDVEGQMRRSLDGFRQDLREHPYILEIDRRRRRGLGLWRPMGKGIRVVLAAGAGAAALVILSVWLLGRGMGGPAQPAWADVVDRFRSVPAFSATVYTKKNALAPAEDAELWMGRDGRVRMRAGATMVFAQNGKVLKAFDLNTRKATEASAPAVAALARLGAKREFALEAVLSCVSAGQIMQTTRLVTPAESATPDLAVFDITSPPSSEHIRVWALAGSKLPTRVWFSDPSSGVSVEAIFSYTKERPDEFFDPAAFEEQLRTTISDAGLSPSSFHVTLRTQVGLQLKNEGRTPPVIRNFRLLPRFWAV